MKIKIQRDVRPDLAKIRDGRGRKLVWPLDQIRVADAFDVSIKNLSEDDVTFIAKNIRKAAANYNCRHGLSYDVEVTKNAIRCTRVA